jgi:hypothetical protein
LVRLDNDMTAIGPDISQDGQHHHHPSSITPVTCLLHACSFPCWPGEGLTQSVG